jgi:hypothetical protein
LTRLMLAHKQNPRTQTRLIQNQSSGISGHSLFFQGVQ